MVSSEEWKETIQRRKKNKTQNTHNQVMRMEIISAKKQYQEESTEYEEDFILIHQNSLRHTIVVVFVSITRMNTVWNMPLPVLSIFTIATENIHEDINNMRNTSMNMTIKEWIFMSGYRDLEEFQKDNPNIVLKIYGDTRVSKNTTRRTPPKNVYSYPRGFFVGPFSFTTLILCFLWHFIISSII